MKLPAFVIIFILTFSLGHASIKEDIVNLIVLFQKDKDKQKKYFVQSEHRGPDAKSLISERVLTFHTNTISMLEKFEVVEVKEYGDYAAAVIIGHVKGHPYKVRVLPLCLMKEKNSWKVTPMLSVFQFIPDLGNQSERIKIKELETWLYEKSIAIYLEKSNRAYEVFWAEVGLKRSEINRICKTPKSVVEYFFTQIEEKSISGICAVAGWDTTQNVYHRDSIDILIDSIRIGLDPDQRLRGGWKIIANHEAERIYIKSVVEKFADDEVPDHEEVIFGYIDQSIPDLCEVVGFVVSESNLSYYIDIPADLVIDNHGNRKGFNSNNFLEWNHTESVIEVKNSMPNILFEKVESQFFKSEVDLLIAEKEIKTNGSLVDYMGLYYLRPDRNKEEGMRALKDVISNWQMRSKLRPSICHETPVMKSEDGNYGLSMRLKCNPKNLSESEVTYKRFFISPEGWCLLANDIELYQDEQFDKLMSSVGVDEKAAITKMLGELGAKVKHIDATNIYSSPLPSKAKLKVFVQSYVNAAMTGNSANLFELGRVFLEDKFWSLDIFVEEVERFSNYDSVKVKDIKRSEFGIGAVHIQVTSGELVEHLIYGIIQEKDSLYLDIENNFLITKSDSLLFLERIFEGNRWKFVEKCGGKIYKDFLKSYYDSLNTKLFPTTR